MTVMSCFLKLAGWLAEKNIVFKVDFTENVFLQFQSKSDEAQKNLRPSLVDCFGCKSA